MSNPRKHLLIVYHSQSGTTERLAQAAYRGASSEPEVALRIRPAMEAATADLLWCDGVIFAAAENLGYLSGGIKDFFDRTFYPSESHQLNIPYAVVISAGNDGTGAVRQLQRIVKGYPMRGIAEPIIERGELSVEGIQRCEDLGAAMAAGLLMGIF